MKREEIEKLIDEKIKAALGGGVTTQSGGGGTGNPPQPGGPKPL